jgi:hypothetical protein
MKLIFGKMEYKILNWLKYWETMAQFLWIYVNKCVSKSIYNINDLLMERSPRWLDPNHPESEWKFVI